MAKRQVHYDNSQLDELINKGEMVNFIMVDKAVYFAKPISLKSEYVKVKNSKGHTLDLPIAQIEDIWGETKAIYS